MDAAQVGRSIYDIRSTVDAGDRRSNSAAGTPAAPMTPTALPMNLWKGLVRAEIYRNSLEVCLQK